MKFSRPSLDPKQREAERRAKARARAKRIAQQRPHLLAEPGRASMVGGTRAAVPKRAYVRSAALLAAVRKLPCQVTGRTDGVEPAHSNWQQHGKAKSVKADDNRVAALHSSLHREIDQGHLLSEAERQELWWTAHQRTVREVLARGLWPKRVPVPQIDDFWKP